MKHIFDAWREVSLSIKAAGCVLLVLDYDGTLSPIVEHPALAVLSKTARDKIRYLSSHAHFSIGIISGRSLEDIKRKIGLDDIYYAGNHGLEIESPKMKFTSPEAKKLMVLMLRLEGQLADKLSSIRGVFVENKNLTLSIHFRKAKEKEIARLKDIFDNSVRPFLRRKEIVVANGKKVLEVRPNLGIDKGKAFLWMFKDLQFSHPEIIAVYVGDDQTDESAFEAVNRKKGLSVFVGKPNKNSRALYYLKSPKEAEVFLGKLKELNI